MRRAVWLFVLTAFISVPGLAPRQASAYAQDEAQGFSEEDFDDLLEEESLDGALDNSLDDASDEDLEALLEGDDVFAGVGDDDGGSGGALLPLTGWKGFGEIKPRIFLFDRGQGKNDEQLLFEAELELDFRFHSSLSGYLRPRILVDALDGSLKRFEPYEGYLTYEWSWFDFRAGQFVENWGIVDTYNPIDVINRRDFASDILDPDRLGELGARLRLLFDGNDTMGEPTVSAYWLPVWQQTLFPTESQRFSFSSPGAEFDVDSAFEPSGYAERTMYATRYQSTLSTAPINADIQFLASYGPERTPSITLDTMGLLVPAYYGATTLGAGFRAVPNQDIAGQFLSTLTLKTEVVFKSPYTFDNSGIERPDDYLAYVVGVDREFYDVIFQQDLLTTTMEYAGEMGAEDPTTILRPFRNDMILRTLWQLNDFSRTSLELRGIVDLGTTELIFEGVFERQLRFIHEDLKFRVQAQFFDPKRNGESFFGFFPNNSSFAVALRQEF